VTDEDELEGEAIAPLLARGDTAAIIGALLGCHAYRDDPDRLSTVVASMRRDVYIISGDRRLRQAMDACTTDDDRRTAADRQRIAAFGITAPIDADDPPALVEAVESRACARWERHVRQSPRPTCSPGAIAGSRPTHRPCRRPSVPRRGSTCLSGSADRTC
jgi:hypothetical protein